MIFRIRFFARRHKVLFGLDIEVVPQRESLLFARGLGRFVFYKIVDLEIAVVVNGQKCMNLMSRGYFLLGLPGENLDLMGFHLFNEAVPGGMLIS